MTHFKKCETVRNSVSFIWLCSEKQNTTAVESKTGVADYLWTCQWCCHFELKSLIMRACQSSAACLSVCRDKMYFGTLHCFVDIFLMREENERGVFRMGGRGEGMHKAMLKYHSISLMFAFFFSMFKCNIVVVFVCVCACACVCRLMKAGGEDRAMAKSAFSQPTMWSCSSRQVVPTLVLSCISLPSHSMDRPAEVWTSILYVPRFLSFHTPQQHP